MSQSSRKRKKKKTTSTDNKGRQSSFDDDSKREDRDESGTPGYWSSWRVEFIVGVILVASYFLRAVDLDLKPAHFDEGINGFFVQKIWREGYYHYDPNNFHGPLYFYFLQFAELLFGRGIIGFRLITGLISVSCVVLAAKHRRFLGASAIWAALVMAVSTGFVFYSRYAIHESLFVFCQLLFSYGYFLWQEERSRKSVACMTAGFFATIAIKETFFIFFITWMIAAGAVRILRRNPKPRSIENRVGFWNQVATGNDWILAASLGCMFLIVLFTGFFINPGGFRDMFAAFALWTKTGTANSGHEKPFFYWLNLLWRYEWPGLLALTLALPLFYFLENRKRLIVLFACGAWLSYSIIPYKTPWLILNLLWPLAFVFGFIFEIVRKFPTWNLRWASRLILLGALVVNVESMLRLNFHDFALPSEPYVYVQSTNQMKYVVDFISERVKLFPEDLNMKILALVKDPWPLPWLFNSYPHLEYGNPDKIDLTDASVIMVDGSTQKILEDRLPKKYWRVRFQIRDSYEQGFCYLDFDKFKGIVPSDSEIALPVGGAK